MANIPVNSGTGPGIAVDLAGTDYIQLVKILQSTSGQLGNPTAVMAVTNTGTAAVSLSALPAVSGSVSVINTPTFTLSTALGVIAVSGGGGGFQYTMNTTTMGNTGQGNIIIGMQSGATTGRAVVVTTSGHQYVQISTGTVTSIMSGTANVLVTNVLSASGVTVQSIATVLGTVAVSGAGGGAQYERGAAIPTTGTGTIAIGVQSGATTGRAILVTTTGAQVVSFSDVVTVTGTVGALMLQKLDSTNDSVTAYTPGAATAWSAYAINTTSGASVILKTSGAHTLYITDLMVSVDVPSMVSLFSDATTKLVAYLATKGGFVLALRTPMALNSAQSLTFQPSASGSCAAFACGYTVT